IKSTVLLDKPSRRAVDIKADYTCFEVPDDFIVGFGLDFNQKYRNLPYLGILKEECYEKNDF
ncbi:MAG: hypoxanthine phosphoribosyltransferase, partial [Eubacterium sp.]